MCGKGRRVAPDSLQPCRMLSWASASWTIRSPGPTRCPITVTLVACPLVRVIASSVQGAGEFALQTEVWGTGAGQQPTGGSRCAVLVHGLFDGLAHLRMRGQAQVVVAGEGDEFPAVDDRPIRHPTVVDQEVRVGQAEFTEPVDPLVVRGDLGEALDAPLLLRRRGAVLRGILLIIAVMLPTVGRAHRSSIVSEGQRALSDVNRSVSISESKPRSSTRS